MSKYKKGLVADIQKKKKFEKEQQHLKIKHHIQDDKIVIEKSNMVKFTIRTLSGIIRVVAAIMVCSLAVIGLERLVYPEPRADLLKIADNILLQLQWYLGI